MGLERLRHALRHKLAQAHAPGIAVSGPARPALLAAFALGVVLGLGCTGEGGPHPEPPNTHTDAGVGPRAGSGAPGAAGRAGGNGGRAGTGGSMGAAGTAASAGAGGAFHEADAGPQDGGTQCDEDAGVSGDCDDAGALN